MSDQELDRFAALKVRTADPGFQVKLLTRALGRCTDETLYWLRLIGRLSPASCGTTISRLRKDADELVAIFVASRRTAILNEERG